jgi:drug/metabolite transporter (DMT)-like permease
MWSLFTAALTRGESTTKVAIINTSANFMLTAFAGWMVFGEELPALWWVGAGGLVVGNVVIGRREERGRKDGGGEWEREGGGGEWEREELVDIGP